MFNEYLLVAGLLLVGGMFGYLLTAWNNAAPRPGRGSERREATRRKYAAVSIQSFGRGCAAARALRGKRFLAREAPPLPLPDCGSERCGCRYFHHVDRRTGNLDRRRAGGGHETPASVEEQRDGRGRRARDWALAYQITQPGS